MTVLLVAARSDLQPQRKEKHVHGKDDPKLGSFFVAKMLFSSLIASSHTFKDCLGTHSR